ncbi:MAG: DNA polymerase II [Nitrospiraceae bacterium]|mgnify:CR=1 FL=1|nr:DNA polymerase II [Nitrospiraceae bacterium]
MSAGLAEKNESIVESEELIDTSKMSDGKRDALQLAESSRDIVKPSHSFVSQLFMGHVAWDMIYPFREQPAKDKVKGDAFLGELETFLREHTDPDQIDQDGEIPQDVIDALGKMGAFGIKIPPEYGGLGLSQTNYSRAAILLGSHCGNLTALLSAHQSIGVPQPLIMFGTVEQKQKYLSRVAKGEISAFALTEEGVGSDPAKIETRAEPIAGGSHFILNGKKLWCTNGTRAGLLIVMARTPDALVRGKPTRQITAFIIETNTPGVTVDLRCRFMGLRSLYNGVIQFTNVKVPRENIILGEGKGLKVAFSTLNTGRLTLPAACLGLSKRCLQIARIWADTRVQWGAAIGKHSAIAAKIATIASDTFALEAMTLLTSSLADRKEGDIRLEAAMSKLWGTEAAWHIVDETMQIRGGRGYETAQSLAARGEEPISVERLMRDSRINLIFEGSSEIMRLFIAREALDPHLRLGATVINPKVPMVERIRATGKAAKFYAGWYAKQWWLLGVRIPAGMDRRLVPHARYVGKTSKKLARTLFHQILWYGPKLEREQMMLGRLMNVGTELFAMAATCSKAQALLTHDGDRNEIIKLVDFFCQESRLRLTRNFQGINENNDRRGYRLARQILKGKYEWLEEGIVARTSMFGTSKS